MQEEQNSESYVSLNLREGETLVWVDVEGVVAEAGEEAEVVVVEEEAMVSSN